MIDEPSSSNKKPKVEWWKIVCFTLGILMIAGATTYALTTRNNVVSNGILENGTAATTPALMGIGDLLWVQILVGKFTDHNFFFVILPGGDSDSTTTLANRVAEAAAKIEAKGARVETMTLSSSDPEFSITTERLAITQLPAVLALSNSGNGAIVTGDITEGKLLQTYVVVSQPVCAPGSSPGCCGSK